MKVIRKVPKMETCRWHDCDGIATKAVESAGQSPVDQKFRITLCEKHGQLVGKNLRRPVVTMNGQIELPHTAGIVDLPRKDVLKAGQVTKRGETPHGVQERPDGSKFAEVNDEEESIAVNDWVVMDGETCVGVYSDAAFKLVFDELAQAA